jgi:indole-3-glycerol phosphate synthase
MKDFIFDPYQVYEAKLCKADIILLIARILQVQLFKELLKLAQNLGMEAVIEIHKKKEMEMVLNEVNDFSGIILGINNRNLDTLRTNVQTTFDLLSCLKGVKIPVISESGIRDKETVKKLFDAGVNGILIGEHLLRTKTPSREIKRLLKGIT